MSGIVREVTNTCQECGGGYWVKPYRRTKSRFCSQACAGSFTARTVLNVGPKPWAAKNLDGHRHKSTSRFSAGHEPWNKEMKGIHLSPDSEWDAGSAPSNSLPLGSVTIRNDKAGKPRAFVKTGAGWEMRARVVYAAKHGGIPEGHVVHHIDGNTLNDRPQNLAALTRSDHIAEHRSELLDAHRQSDLFISKPAYVAPVQEGLI